MPHCDKHEDRIGSTMIRLVKRYGGGSRKLYDTEESRYVPLQEIRDWIRGGQELRVVDSRTGQDVTAQTLAQLIYEDERRGVSLVSSGFLHELIRQGEKALQGVNRLLQASAGRLTPVREARSEMEALRTGLRRLERSVSLLERGTVGSSKRRGGTWRRPRKHARRP